MGHRKHSAPRRGSLAYRPRARAGSFIPSIHNWPKIGASTPSLLGFPGVNVGMLHAITTDDREKTPNFGKPLYNSATVVAVPEVSVVGVRFYATEYGSDRAVGEFYSKEYSGKEGYDPVKAAESWKASQGFPAGGAGDSSAERRRYFAEETDSPRGWGGRRGCLGPI
ncbi:MAG: 50S ribosomal protein L3 [Thaumarchaeota archaeon]|nr:50S ribosomal protein L3 [Nitrososphaerota archaeon]